MYELAFGVTPFRGARRDVTFDNILHKPLGFPTKVEVSDEFKDVVRGRFIFWGGGCFSFFYGGSFIFGGEERGSDGMSGE